MELLVERIFTGWYKGMEAMRKESVGRWERARRLCTSTKRRSPQGGVGRLKLCFSPVWPLGVPGKRGFCVSPKEGKALRILSKECVYVYRYLHAIPRVAKRGRQSPNTEVNNADKRHVGAENQSHLL